MSSQWFSGDFYDGPTLCLFVFLQTLALDRRGHVNPKASLGLQVCATFRKEWRNIIGTWPCVWRSLFTVTGTRTENTRLGRQALAAWIEYMILFGMLTLPRHWNHNWKDSNSFQNEFSEVLGALWRMARYLPTWRSPRRQYQEVYICQISENVFQDDYYYDLGTYYLDSTMSMTAHVTRIIYAILHTVDYEIARIRSSLPLRACSMLVHALVTSSLDFANGTSPSYRLQCLELIFMFEVQHFYFCQSFPCLA